MAEGHWTISHLCVCVLPDVKRAFLCGAERRGAGTDTAGHHLFPQVMDLCLKTTVLYTQRQTKGINIVRTSRVQRTCLTLEQLPYNFFFFPHVP